MASRGISGSLDIWETRAAKQQLEQYEGLSRDFRELDQAIALLPATQDNLSVASYRPFLDIINSDLSPNWTETSGILSDIFGELGQATKQEVPRGYGGIIALRKAVGRTRIDDEKVGEIRHWLFLVTRSVHHTREIIARNPVTPDSILPNNGAASSHRGRNSSVSANSQVSTSSNQNLLATNNVDGQQESRNLDSPPRSQSLSVNPNLETTEQPSAPPGRRATSKRSRESGVSPETSSEDKPETPRKRNKGKGRAEESNETDANGKGKRREGLGQTAKRVTRSSSGGNGENKGEREKEETPRRVSPTPVADPRNDAEASPPLRPLLSPEEQLVRSVFPSIPLDIKLSSTSTPRPPHIDFETPFERPDIGGGPQVIDNPGTRGKNWALNRNHLCIRTSLNLCKLATSAGNTRLFAPGEPIVIPIEMSAGKVHRTFIANPEVGKHRSVANVWIKDQDEDSWLYRGLYEIAYDGSEEENVEYLPVPTGSEEKVRIHTELERLVKEHATKKKKDETTVRLERALEDWGFEARNREAAVLEMGTRNEGDRRKHVKYIALRCVGWDEESWRIWTRKRNKRLRIAN